MLTKLNQNDQSQLKSSTKERYKEATVKIYVSIDCIKLYYLTVFDNEAVSKPFLFSFYISWIKLNTSMAMYQVCISAKLLLGDREFNLRFRKVRDVLECEVTIARGIINTVSD